jgi:hypothetical protein
VSAISCGSRRVPPPPLFGARFDSRALTIPGPSPLATTTTEFLGYSDPRRLDLRPDPLRLSPTRRLCPPEIGRPADLSFCERRRRLRNGDHARPPRRGVSARFPPSEILIACPTPMIDLTLLAIPRFRNGFPRPRSTCNCTTRSVSPDHSLRISRCWSTRTGASSVSEPATSASKITS